MFYSVVVGVLAKVTVRCDKERRWSVNMLRTGGSVSLPFFKVFLFFQVKAQKPSNSNETGSQVLISPERKD